MIWTEVWNAQNRAGDGTCHNLTEVYFTKFIGMNALLFDYPMQTEYMCVNLPIHDNDESKCVVSI